jgi:hypothetical protein
MYEPEVAAEMCVKRKDELVAGLDKTRIDGIHRCIDSELKDYYGGMALYVAKPDFLKHAYTAMHRKIIELHATIRANLEVTIDYLLSKYPDTVIALFSDHGHATTLSDREWTSHGYQTGTNTGFLILLHPSFASKPKKNPQQPESSSLIYLQFLSILKRTNFPLYSDSIPISKFVEDPEDRIRTLRLKEMQLIKLLGSSHFTDSPF